MLLSLEHFDSYIRGSSSSSLEEYLGFYDEKPELLRRDLHHLKIFANSKTKKCVRSILKDLNIPETEWKNYDPNLTVYEFLLQLARDGHPQVDFIILLIDKKSKFNKLELFLGGGIFLTFVLYLLLQPGFQFIIDGLIHFFSMVISFPILGLVFNCLVFAYYFFESDYDKKKTDFNRYRDNIFLVLSSLSTVSAYIILIATSAAMSPTIAWLYILSSAIDVFREFFCLTQEFIVYLNSSPFDLDDQLSKHRSQERRVFGFEKRRNALGLNFAAGILIVIITALWCFLPGGIPATIFALSAIGIVHLIKHALIKRDEADLREKLQKKLEDLELATLSPNENIDHPPLQLSNLIDEQSLKNDLPRQKSKSHFSAGERPFFNTNKSSPVSEEFESNLVEFSESESEYESYNNLH
ncbi:MAG: hypothetical protein H0U73_06845 [Tatlockia sp.]|nr:hypothetical protein [Tatlockia sp.]